LNVKINHEEKDYFMVFVSGFLAGFRPAALQTLCCLAGK
jgi:hypothetical protein